MPLINSKQKIKIFKLLAFNIYTIFLGLGFSHFTSGNLFLEAVTYVRLDLLAYTLGIIPIIAILLYIKKENETFEEKIAFIMAAYSCAPMIMDNIFFYVSATRLESNIPILLVIFGIDIIPLIIAYSFRPRIITDTQFYILWNIPIDLYQIITIIYFCLGWLVWIVVDKKWEISSYGFFVIGIYIGLITQKIVETLGEHYAPEYIYVIVLICAIFICTFLTIYWWREEHENRIKIRI